MNPLFKQTNKTAAHKVQDCHIPRPQPAESQASQLEAKLCSVTGPLTKSKTVDQTLPP